MALLEFGTWMLNDKRYVKTTYIRIWFVPFLPRGQETVEYCVLLLCQGNKKNNRLLSDKCSVREIPWKDKIKDKSKVSLIFFFSCICIRHQNGRKVMSVRDVVVLSSGISRLCGIRKQWVWDRYDLQAAPSPNRSPSLSSSVSPS